MKIKVLFSELYNKLEKSNKNKFDLESIANLFKDFVQPTKIELKEYVWNSFTNFIDGIKLEDFVFSYDFGEDKYELITEIKGINFSYLSGSLGEFILKKLKLELLNSFKFFKESYIKEFNGVLSSDILSYYKNKYSFTNERKDDLIVLIEKYIYKIYEIQNIYENYVSIPYHKIIKSIKYKEEWGSIGYRKIYYTEGNNMIKIEFQINSEWEKQWKEEFLDEVFSHLKM